MSVTPIRLYGDPVLRTRAASVTVFDRELETLISDLTETMMHAPGAGLAAPQIGVGLRVFTYYVDGQLGHIINPELALSPELQCGPEGCLSIPGMLFDTTRSLRAVATGFDMHGEPITVEGSDLLARCMQHETDHLNGILFVDRLDTAARRAALKAIRSSEWAGLPGPIIRDSPHPTYGELL